MFDKLLKAFAFAFSGVMMSLGMLYIIALVLIPFGILWSGYQIVNWLITK